MLCWKLRACNRLMMLPGPNDDDDDDENDDDDGDDDESDEDDDVVCLHSGLVRGVSGTTMNTRYR